ncbi:MAG: hypothetical protein VX747_05155, partial [Actinomycetota bacterium]|nr:hypothetical protein [Actinomycetota bacterium]
MPLDLTLRRALLALPALALVAGSTAVVGTPSSAADGTEPAAMSARKAKDPRKTRGLYVDTRMPAHQQGPAYSTIAKRAQALWLGSEYYPTDQVAGVV